MATLTVTFSKGRDPYNSMLCGQKDRAVTIVLHMQGPIEFDPKGERNRFIALHQYRTREGM